MNSYPYIFLQRTFIALLSVLLLACEDEEVNDAVPDYPAAVGISNNSVTNFSTRSNEVLLTEGDTAILIVGIFSDRDNDQNVTVDWSATGAVSLNGQATIEAGTKVDTVLLPIPENTVANDTVAVTFSLSNINPGDIPFVPEEGRESVTFEIIDDTKTLRVENDSLNAIESDGILSIPIDVTSDLDEDVQVAYTVGGTAVEGVDYELVSPSPVTIGSGDDPAINIRLLNNSDLQDERTLDVNVTGVTSSNQEVNLDANSGTIVYTLSDDTKAIGFERLDIATPIEEDTLVINAPGTYEVSIGVTGDLLGEATVEINSTDFPTGVTPLVSSPLTFVPDEEARPYSFSVSGAALSGLTEDAFFTITLENATAANGDNEVIVREDANQIVVQLVAPE